MDEPSPDVTEELNRSRSSTRRRTMGGLGVAGMLRGVFGESRRSRNLMRAIARHELYLEYQPKISLRQRRVASVEALVRWAHPRKGLIPPGDFIPSVEDTAAIRHLTYWVVTTAIRDQAEMNRYVSDLPVFVNVAASLLTDRDFVMDLCDQINNSTAKIGLEITETSVIRDPETAIRNLGLISEAGIPLAIDDYGAGLSSLAYLKRLPAQELKIDKLFITQLTSTQRDPLIVRSTIDLAHAMEMEVVAEGIENQTALALLTVMGCDLAQGFHISRPLALRELLLFLERHKAGWSQSGEEGSGGLLRISA